MLIAEVGTNHRGDIQKAKDLIYSAKESGADIVKFQLYDVDTICKPDYEFYNELKQSQVSLDMWREITSYADSIKLEYLASVFDTERINWCKEMRRFKVASRSIYDTELLDKILSTGKDMIISLGMTDKRGIPSYKTARIYYLYCVSNYPAKLEDLKLATVDFRRYAGFSDHTPGVEASIVAISRGAKIVEKHFDLKPRFNDPCNSISPYQLKQIADFVQKWELMK